MRWIQENTHIVFQHLAEVVDGFAALREQIRVLVCAGLRAEFLSQSCHDCDKSVMRTSENPFAQLDPCVD